MKRKILIAGAAFGALAVILGALGAHALKARLIPDQLNSYETAVRFQMYHALALLALGLLMKHGESKLLNGTYLLFTVGTILFSGSIYFLTTRDITGLHNIGWLGPVTPLGGLLLTAGWILMLMEGIRQKAS